MMSARTIWSRDIFSLSYDVFSSVRVERNGLLDEFTEEFTDEFTEKFTQKEINVK